MGSRNDAALIGAGIAGVSVAGSRGSQRKLIRSTRARRRAFEKEHSKLVDSFRAKFGKHLYPGDLSPAQFDEIFTATEKLREKWGV